MQTKKINSSIRYICDHCNQKYYSADEALDCEQRHMDDDAEEHKLQTAWEEATIEQRIDALMGALTNHCNVPLARIIESL